MRQKENPGAVARAGARRGNHKSPVNIAGVSAAQASPEPIMVFKARCEARALLFANGELDLIEAVDELQASAVGNGLIRELGQDQVQAFIAEAFERVRR
jgi:hypothetical protein